MSQTNRKPNALTSILHFWKRQDPNWKVTVGRTSLEKFGYQMVFPYLSIYIVALGATKTQLGLVTSIGMVIAGILGPFTGILIDRIGLKKIYLFGIAMLMISYLVYALAPNWIYAMLAMSIYWIGNSSSGHSCSTICGNCLQNADRARGMMLCETAAAGLLGIASPMIAAFLLAQLGGVSVANIRPLFYIAFVTAALSFILIWTKLKDIKWATKHEPGTRLIRDGFKILKGNPVAQRWLVIGALNRLPFGLILPFTQVFAQEMKGANGYILGAMVTGTALTSLVFGLPAGVLADKIGRKKTLYILIPLFWAANLILVLAPSPGFLVLAGVMLGFYYIMSPIMGAIEMELVPPHQMGRWLGLNQWSNRFSGPAWL
ncbi:MAG: MFS transporter [Clostridiales bacterium]|nr:MFS transporter [Clostridiales bacterium]